ncbi:MAG TPA: hypothetical protein VFU46_14905 [Gemmatimonadales bacterium]|nr:hypothetical protein [Gemmatimonadales bacterium]
MYRIELGPDDIGVFRSMEEMATAIRSGVIGPRCRIFHQASDKWLPIEFHPHYRKALELASSAAPPAPSPVPVTTPLPTRVPVSAPPVPAPVVKAPRSIAGLPLINVSKPERPAPAAAPAPAPAPAAPRGLDRTESALPPPAPLALPAPPAPPVLPVEPEPVEEPAGLAAEPVRMAEPPEPAARPQPEPQHARVAEPKQLAVAVPPEPAQAEPEPRPVARRRGFSLRSMSRVDLDLRARRPRRPYVIALAAMVLAGSTHAALSSAPPPWRLGVSVPLPFLQVGPSPLRAERPDATPTAASLPARVSPEPQGSPSFGAASAFSEARPASAGAAAAAPAAPPRPPADSAPRRDSVPLITPAPKIAIVAPKISGSPLNGEIRSAGDLLARYEAAYTAARSELETGLRTAGFANLFATARLQPSGVRAARLATGTATAYVTKYRRREAEIEQAYSDSFNLLAASKKWSPAQRRAWASRRVQREHPEVVKLSTFLLQSLDSLYGVLSAQDGGYRLSDGSIAFDEASAARAYAELRPWLDRRAHAWADSATATPTTAARILQAMGTARLPEGGAF